jgi:hypothetical protein
VGNCDQRPSTRSLRIGRPVSRELVTLLLEPRPDLYRDALAREGCQSASESRFFVLLCAQLLGEVNGRVFSYAVASTLWRRRSKPARPYMERLIAFNRLICPSTGPVLQDSVSAACTAS